MNRTPEAISSIEDRTPHGESIMLTVREAARLLRISRNLCYELVNQGKLPHLRLGRRILLPRYGLEQWVVQQSGLSPTTVVSFSSPQQD